MSIKGARAKTLEDFLGLKYQITFEEDPDGGYVAEIPDLPGCYTQGEDLEEAMENIQEAKALWMETALEKGIPIPSPSHEKEFSGKILFRVPSTLHMRLIRNAKREGVSLNQYLLMLVAENHTLQTVATYLETVAEAAGPQLMPEGQWASRLHWHGRGVGWAARMGAHQPASLIWDEAKRGEGYGNKIQ